MQKYNLHVRNRKNFCINMIFTTKHLSYLLEVCAACIILQSWFYYDYVPRTRTMDFMGGLHIERKIHHPNNAYSIGNTFQSFQWKLPVNDSINFYRRSLNNITLLPLSMTNSSATSSKHNFYANSDISYELLKFDPEPKMHINKSEDSAAVEDINSFNHFSEKEKFLDNSFYDLHLNTAAPTIRDLQLPQNKTEDEDQEKWEQSPFFHSNVSKESKWLKQKEYAMADVLYKQDVDLGFTLSAINSQANWTSNTQLEINEEVEKVRALQGIKDSKLAEILYQQDIDLGYNLIPETLDNPSPPNVMPSLSKKTDFKPYKADKANNDELIDNDGWSGIPFKIDNETGEYIRQPLDDLFQDILPYAENISTNFKLKDVNEEEAGNLDDAIKDISAIMQSFWPSTQDQKPNANYNHSKEGKQEIFNRSENEIRPALIPSALDMDPRSHDLSNHLTQLTGFDGISPDLSSYTHYHSKLNKSVFPYTSRQNSLHEPLEGSVCFQAHFIHNLDSTRHVNLDNAHPNAENQGIKNLTNIPTDLVQPESFFGAFLNEECIPAMEIKSLACRQNDVLTLSNTNSMVHQCGEKSINANSSLCSNNVQDRLDLSCDSAVSSIGSERINSTSDGEWGEGSDSGQDYQHSNYYGPYDYSSNSSNFTPRQIPAAQKKYHMFGKRYFQDQTQENSKPQSAIQYLNASSPVVECDGIENMVESSTFDDCSEEILSYSKNSNKISYSNIKAERDKPNVGSNQIGSEHISSHNHTYALSNTSNLSMRSSFAQDSFECKHIQLDGHLTRDEKRARNLNVPIPVPEIINLPMDEFNERISKYDLTENQLSLIRDIRRRGKNKVAAQNCRKRKLDQILSLEGEVKEVRRRKEKLHSDRDMIATEKKRIANKFANLHQHIFQFLRDDEGNPCSPSKYSLQQASDGSIYLLPRDSSKCDSNFPMSILFASREKGSSSSRQMRTQKTIN